MVDPLPISIISQITKYMDTQVVDGKNFKMTFNNSFWQCCIALLCFKPIQLIIATMLVVTATSISGYSSEITQDLINFSNIIVFILVAWLARYLAKQSWLRKQKKAAATATT